MHIDIDDVFVAKRGTRMVTEDVEVRFIHSYTVITHIIPRFNCVLVVDMGLALKFLSLGLETTGSAVKVNLVNR